MRFMWIRIHSPGDRLMATAISPQDPRGPVGVHGPDPRQHRVPGLPVSRGHHERGIHSFIFFSLFFYTRTVKKV